jgi:secreted trypsin-like serine protease
MLTCVPVTLGPVLRRLVCLVVAVPVLVLTAVPAAQAAEPRIVGGTTSTGSAHPWLVQVWGPRQTTLCGGVLLHERLVLTAAHCVPESGSLAGYTMYAGRTSLTSGGERLSLAAGAHVAPSYDADTLVDDWALVELAADAAATPLLLAGADEATAWDAGSDAVVAGFGTTTEDGEVSPTLRQVTVPVLADAGCAAYGTEYDAATMLCAGVLTGGQDSCGGDSGGPLRVTTDAGQPRLAGLVSWGNGCARAGYPGIYTRLAGDPVRTELLATVAAETDVDPAEIVGSPTTTTTTTTTTTPGAGTACTSATATLKSRTTALSAATSRLRTATTRLRQARATLARLQRQHRGAGVRRQRVVVGHRRDRVVVLRGHRAEAAAAVAEARAAAVTACA